jgi:hypothetical protein
MFEGCPRPAHGPVATVAGHCRWNMSGGLALRGTLIVASGAGSRSHAVVRKKRGPPICRPVAAVTVDRGRQMVCRLKGGDDSPPWRMALHALPRRSSIYALQVTSFTHDLRVATAERESGTAVIEFYVGATRTILGLCLARQHDTEPQDHCDEHRGDHPPLTQRAMGFAWFYRHSKTITFIRC